MIILKILLALMGLFWAVKTIEALLYGGRVPFLKDIDVSTNPSRLRVSIVVAARNEEHDIKAAVQTQLNIDYPLLEVIVVDDRSVESSE